MFFFMYTANEIKKKVWKQIRRSFNIIKKIKESLPINNEQKN